MIIVHEGKIVNKPEDTIVLVFANDDERKRFAEQLTNMPDKQGIRAYATYNAGLDGMEIIINAVKLVDPNFKHETRAHTIPGAE